MNNLKKEFVNKNDNKIIKEYNFKNQLIKSIHYRINGNINYIKEFDNNQLIKIIFYYEHKEAIYNIQEFDKNTNNLIKNIFYRPDAKTIYLLCEYDAITKKINKKMCCKSNGKTTTYIYKYNHVNKKTSQTVYHNTPNYFNYKNGDHFVKGFIDNFGNQTIQEYNINNQLIKRIDFFCNGKILHRIHEYNHNNGNKIRKIYYKPNGDIDYIDKYNSSLIRR